MDCFLLSTEPSKKSSFADNHHTESSLIVINSAHYLWRAICYYFARPVKGFIHLEVLNALHYIGTYLICNTSIINSNVLICQNLWCFMNIVLCVHTFLASTSPTVGSQTCTSRLSVCSLVA